jgi:hypothetical protein
MTDSVEKIEKDIKIFDKQIEVDKNMFVYNILNGMGDNIKRELSTKPSKFKLYTWKIKNFFYNIFKMF